MRSFVVTRESPAPGGPEPWCEALRQRGADVHHVPLIARHLDRAAVARIAEGARGELFFLTSAFAARSVQSRFGGAALAALAPMTSAALEAAGHRVSIHAEGGAHALWEVVLAAEVRPTRIIYPTSAQSDHVGDNKGGDSALVAAMRAIAPTEVHVVYDTRPCTPEVGHVPASAIWILASGSAARAFNQLPLAGAAPVVCVGDTARAALSRKPLAALRDFAALLAWSDRGAAS